MILLDGAELPAGSVLVGAHRRPRDEALDRHLCRDLNTRATRAPRGPQDRAMKLLHAVGRRPGPAALRGLRARLPPRGGRLRPLRAAPRRRRAACRARARPGIDRVWSSAPHEGVARELVTALKFRRLLPVAGLMAERIHWLAPG